MFPPDSNYTGGKQKTKQKKKSNRSTNERREAGEEKRRKLPTERVGASFEKLANVNRATFRIIISFHRECPQPRMVNTGSLRI